MSITLCLSFQEIPVNLRQKKNDMKAMYVSLVAMTIALAACSTSTKEIEEEKNVIHLAEAIENPVKMNLSEIVDSIVFIPDRKSVV